MAGINYNQLRIEIARQAPTAIYSKIKPLMVEEFNIRKNTMIEEFENHPVTRELESGPEANSQFVRTSHGGNLYSLLGFDAEEHPTEAIREVLNQEVKLNLSQTTREVKRDTIVFNTPVRTPTIGSLNESVAEKAPLEWTSRSFTDLIERGIPWFGSYLYDNLHRFKTSRSGTAIEAKNRATGALIKVRDGSMPAIKYMSEILTRFRKLFGYKN